MPLWHRNHLLQLQHEHSCAASEQIILRECPVCMYHLHLDHLGRMDITMISHFLRCTCRIKREKGDRKKKHIAKNGSVPVHLECKAPCPAGLSASFFPCLKSEDCIKAMLNAETVHCETVHLSPVICKKRFKTEHTTH